MTNAGTLLRGAGAILAAVSWAGPAAAICVPGVMSCNFSIKGKDGPFIDAEVDPVVLAERDAATAALTDIQGLDGTSRALKAFDGAGLPMPQTEAALQHMLQAIRAQWPYRDPGPVRFKILASDAYAPSAGADGTITVPLGFLTRAGSDDEIAWVLGHEYMHIALGHFANEQDRGTTRRLFTGLIDTVQLGTQLAQTRIDNDGGNLNFREEADPKMSRLEARAWSLSRDLQVGLGLLDQNLEREQEDEADAGALDMLLRAGYADEGYAAALNRIQANEEALAKSANRAEDLMDRVLTGSQETGLLVRSDAGLGDVLGSLRDDVLANIQTVAAEELIASASRQHRPADKRRRGLSKYQERAHGDLPVRMAGEPEWLNNVRQLEEFADARTTVEALRAAEEALLPNSEEPAELAAAAGVALTALAPAFDTRFADTVVVYQTAGRIHNFAGNPGDAERYFDLASGMDTPIPEGGDAYLLQSVQGYNEHVNFLLAQDRPQRALEVIERAETQLGDADTMLPQLIAVRVRMNDLEGWQEASRRCVQSASQALREQCAAARRSPAQTAMYEQLSPAEQAEMDEDLAREVETNDTEEGIGGALRSLFGGK